MITEGNAILPDVDHPVRLELSQQATYWSREPLYAIVNDPEYGYVSLAEAEWLFDYPQPQRKGWPS